MRPMKARLLGPMALWSHGEGVHLPFKKAYGLLAYVLVNRRVHRDRLMDLLWGDVDRVKASGSLRNALYEIRRHLPPEALVPRRLWVEWGPGWEVDLDLLEEGRLPPEAGDFLEGFSLPECPPSTTGSTRFASRSGSGSGGWCWKAPVVKGIGT